MTRKLFDITYEDRSNTNKRIKKVAADSLQQAINHVLKSSFVEKVWGGEEVGVVEIVTNG